MTAASRRWEMKGKYLRKEDLNKRKGMETRNKNCKINRKGRFKDKESKKKT